MIVGMKKVQKKKGLIIYQGAGGAIEFRGDWRKETIWATQEQIALLFSVQRPAITKHISNILKEGELIEKAVCSILEHTAVDGKKYKTQFYNLDAIIAIGYRVNSKQATYFRIWATKILKEHLFKGYTLDQKRLVHTTAKISELQKTIHLITSVRDKRLSSDVAEGLLSVIRQYADTWTTLNEYDTGTLVKRSGKKKSKHLAYEEVIGSLSSLKTELIRKGEAGELFAVERENTFAGILRTVYQTFNGEELYRSIEDKAAHLLYFIIKDHPFFDGNKRSGAFVFIRFLDLNSALSRKDGSIVMGAAALTALALLVAESRPEEKEQMIALITHLLK
jgi:prophage maintenance system killer protein